MIIAIDFFLVCAFLSYLLIGLFLVVKSGLKPTNILLVLISLSSAIWTAGITLFRIIPPLLPILYFLNSGFIWASAIIASTFLHFSLLFSGKVKKTSLLLSFLIYFPSIIVFILLSNSNVLIDNIVVQSWGRESILGRGYVFFGFFIVFYFLLGLYFLLKSYLNATGNYKLQLLYIILATAITGSVDICFNLIFILFGNYRLIWVGPYSSFVWVLVLAYAITKTRLMDIRVVIGKTFSHLITIALFAGIYSIMAVLYTGLYHQFDWWFFAASICYGILVGETFDRLRQHIQTPFDRFFIKNKYDFSEVTRDMTVKFRKSTTKPSIIENIFPILDNKVDISSVRFFFSDQNDRLIEWDPKELKPIPDSTISPSDPLIVELLKKKEKDVAPLPAESAIKGALCVPSSHDDKILAAIILGKKRSEDDYTEQDLNLFRAISEYIMVSLEFIIKPFEQVTSQFEASERKLMRAEKELYRSQRLASIGTLTAGVTHEIRNPLGVLRSGLEILPKQLRDQTYLNEFRDKYVKYVDRIEGIVEKVLGLARDERVKTERELDLNSLVQGTIKLVNFKDDIKVVFDLQPIPKIKGVEDDLERVIINLAENANHAMLDGGVLTIKTYAKKEEEINKVFVEISDTGIGIPEENKEKIFDPFFSSRHEGTGLGLSICFRIIKEHGGDISFQSEEGKGTTFYLSFIPSSQN